MKDVKQLGAKLAAGPRGKAAHSIDAVAIRELAELLAETGLTEIEVETNGTRLRVARQGTPVYASNAVLSAPAAAPAPAAETKPSGPPAGAVTSPMVGTVYVAPQPGAQPFVKVGDTVKEGDTLLILEAMKTMNPIPSPRGGKITEICVRDAQPVEFGQALVVIA